MRGLDESETLCFIRGKICTMNGAQAFAESVVTRGNRIAFVGDSDTARTFAGRQSRVIDLDGRLVVPGLIDNHTHFVSGGLHLLGLNLRGCSSTREFIGKIGAFVSLHRGSWVTGGDWDQGAWEVKDLPRKEMIDPVSTTTPVFLQRFDGHMGLANSVALRMAGITASTPSPEGGLIEKDPLTGDPTGIVKDTAMNIVMAKVPQPTNHEVGRAVLKAQEEAARNGITSIQDITLTEQLPVLQQMERDGLLTCRVYARLPLAGYADLVRDGIRRGHGSDMLRLGALKAFSDGSLGSSTALFFEPYRGEPSNTGLAMDVLSNGNLRTWALEADRNMMQLCIHAIGDRANALVLSLYEEVTRTNAPWDRRFRIEHAQHVRREDIPSFKRLGVIVSAQPYHCIDDGVWAEKRIGPERIHQAYPFRSFLDAGVMLCFGSDWTVAPLSPLLGIYAAATRRTLDGKHPDGWIPEQKLTVPEALQCYTINNAYASFEENTKGSIETGKLADMVVLDDDIFAIPPEKVRDVNVAMTVVDGRIVFG